MTDQEVRYIENNLQLSNRMIAQELDKSEAQIRNYLNRNSITRSNEQIEQIRLRVAADRTGENNPNWRGGISKNNYHYKRIQIERYPERNRARQRVHYHKSVKNLIPGVCKICGSEKRIEAHHPDYSQPLKVEWLCFKCHRELHKNSGSKAETSSKTVSNTNNKST